MDLFTYFIFFHFGVVGGGGGQVGVGDVQATEVLDLKKHSPGDKSHGPLIGLEKKLNNAREPLGSCWNFGPAYSMMLMEASKSPQWSMGLSECEKIEKDSRCLG
ncbi:unnamed protein product, partial [Ostreobium quekettii]